MPQIIYSLALYRHVYLEIIIIIIITIIIIIIIIIKLIALQFYIREKKRQVFVVTDIIQTLQQNLTKMICFHTR